MLTSRREFAIFRHANHGKKNFKAHSLCAFVANCVFSRQQVWMFSPPN